MCEYKFSCIDVFVVVFRTKKDKEKWEKLMKNIKCAVANTSTVHHFIEFILAFKHKISTLCAV